MLPIAMIGATEWMIIAGVVVLIFGGRKLPELARAMGRSITEFKQGLKSDPELDEHKDEGKQVGHPKAGRDDS